MCSKELAKMSAGGLNLTCFCNKNHTQLDQLIRLNQAYSITSMLTLLGTTAILCAMVFYKAYRTLLQRLFMYLTLSIMAYLIVSSLNIQLQPKIFKHTTETMCKWNGYVGTSVYTSTLLFSFEISIYLLYMMYYQLRGRPLPVPSKCRAGALEVLAVGVAVLLPPAALAPSLEYYGVNGVVCWVKVYHNYTNCKPSAGSLALGKGIFTYYTLFTGTNLIIFAVLIGLFCWLGCRREQSRDQYMVTARRTALLFIMLVPYTLIHLSAILVPYLDLNQQVNLQVGYGGVFVLCIITPLSQFVRPLAYMFYLNSVRKFRWEVTRSAASEWRQSWSYCCLRCWYGLLGRDVRQSLLVNNNLDLRSSEYLTPSVETSTYHYESLGRGRGPPRQWSE